MVVSIEGDAQNVLSNWQFFLCCYYWQQCWRCWRLPGQPWAARGHTRGLAGRNSQSCMGARADHSGSSGVALATHVVGAVLVVSLHFL